MNGIRTICEAAVFAESKANSMSSRTGFIIRKSRHKEKQIKNFVLVITAIRGVLSVSNESSVRAVRLETHYSQLRSGTDLVH